MDEFVEDAVLALEGRLADPDWRVKQAAVESLERLALAASRYRSKYQPAQECYDAIQGGSCYIASEWARIVGVQKHPSWYDAISEPGSSRTSSRSPRAVLRASLILRITVIHVTFQFKAKRISTVEAVDQESKTVVLKAFGSAVPWSTVEAPWAVGQVVFLKNWTVSIYKGAAQLLCGKESRACVVPPDRIPVGCEPGDDLLNITSVEEAVAGNMAANLTVEVLESTDPEPSAQEVPKMVAEASVKDTESGVVTRILMWSELATHFGPLTKGDVIVIRDVQFRDGVGHLWPGRSFIEVQDTARENEEAES
ncbi:unnamed protein product [Prorocentrum cordatum]|uniref:Uncharacterized protein n=1 Tax=Prorocentrum cordatum TaxID=2364126 RepID=A0ABN9VZF1_9DINO|nr:unnamed protein product [Polarella glacialis]